MNLKNIGVVGAGTMGNGIAQVCAQAGLDVVMIDINDAAVQRGQAAIASSLERLVKKDKLTEAERQAAIARVTGSTNYEDLRGAQLVIEAATENLELKLRILRQIDALVGPDTVIATNTSSISITQLAAVVSHSERFVGMHFFNPVPLMGLLEVIRGLQTGDAAHALAVEFGPRLRGQSHPGADDQRGDRRAARRLGDRRGHRCRHEARLQSSDRPSGAGRHDRP